LILRRLYFQKGIHLIIQAGNKLPKKFPEIKMGVPRLKIGAPQYKMGMPGFKMGVP
jgi:hypothetical protein